MVYGKYISKQGGGGSALRVAWSRGVHAWSGGGGCLVSGGVPGPGGCLPGPGGPALGWGCLLLGVPALEGLPGPGGCGIPACTEACEQNS